jgi:hypothetical protein
MYHFVYAECLKYLILLMDIQQINPLIFDKPRMKLADRVNHHLTNKAYDFDKVTIIFSMFIESGIKLNSKQLEIIENGIDLTDQKSAILFVRLLALNL